MKEFGWIAVSRGIFDDPSFRSEPFTEREAFLWLVKEAAWQPREARLSNGRESQVVMLQRGQLSHALRFMADEWQWSIKRVRTFLKQRKRELQIDTQTGTLQTVITINKYNNYQTPLKSEGTQTETQTGTQGARKGHKEKQLNKGTSKPKKEDTCAVADATRTALDSSFEEFWKVKPSRGKASNPKAEAKKAYVAAVNGGAEPEAINAAAAAWAKREADKVGTEFIPMARTWLKGRRFDDYKPDPAEVERSRANEAAMIAKGWTLDPVKGWQKPAPVETYPIFQTRGEPAQRVA